MVTEELENELRRAFAKAGAGVEVSDDALTRLCGRNYHPRRMHRGAAAGAIGGVVLAAATGIAVPLAVPTAAPLATPAAVPTIVRGGSATVASGARIRLDSYTFTMPAGYHAVHGRSACVPGIGIHIPQDRSGRARVPNFRLPKVPAPMQAAASADGGCVGLMLLPAYRLVPGSPDPYAIAGSRPVRAGGRNALLYKFRSYVRGSDGRMVPERPGNFELLVELPAPGGKVRDLVIGSDNLTKRQLIAIAVSGLSP